MFSKKVRKEINAVEDRIVDRLFNLKQEIRSGFVHRAAIDSKLKELTYYVDDYPRQLTAIHSRMDTLQRTMICKECPSNKTCCKAVNIIVHMDCPDCPSIKKPTKKAAKCVKA